MSGAGERFRARADAAAAAVLAPSPLTRWRRRVFGHRGFAFGAAVLLLVLLMAILAPLLAPADPYAQDLAQRLIPPVWHAQGSWVHPLGTDQLGRDYLARLLYGARISLLIGVSTMAISGLIGGSLGILAGYFGGRVDLAISFLLTVRLSLPVILVALAVVAVIHGSLEVVILVLGALLWDRFLVVMRSTTQQIRRLDYIAAAAAVGASTFRILVGEVLPNALNNLIVVATLEMAHAILLEAALSFLGLGVQPPLPSWGLMLSEGKPFMFFSPWLITIPGTMLFLLVLAINLLGDGVRDLTAPENRG
ncbi:MAG TPA: ABC transporter permease [Alphaproteobacteria bacterium]|nr:ABC transporter permease [Alphaproteobacteria bacterium]